MKGKVQLFLYSLKNSLTFLCKNICLYMHILLTKNITRLYACIHKYLAFKYISGLGMQLMAEEYFLPVQGCRLSAQF